MDLLWYVLFVAGAVIGNCFGTAAHELGHFVAAKLCRIPVLRFCVWGGKPLVRRHWRGIVWQLGRLPSGGHVVFFFRATIELAKSNKEIAALLRDRAELTEELADRISQRHSALLLLYAMGPGLQLIVATIAVLLFRHWNSELPFVRGLWLMASFAGASSLFNLLCPFSQKNVETGERILIASDSFWMITFGTMLVARWLGYSPEIEAVKNTVARLTILSLLSLACIILIWSQNDMWM